jgi:chemosensory pili system protein ChpE/L-lysine exporter family protein LysE/ArgO
MWDIINTSPTTPVFSFPMIPAFELLGMAFLLGFIFNATPGAVFAETIRHGMSGGYRAALSVQFGSLVGDAAWAALGLAGIGLLLQADSLKIPVGIAGAGYLAWLAWDSWRASRGEAEIMVPNQEGSAMRSGVVLSLSNPQNVAYWAALGSAFGALGISHPDSIDYTLFFLGFMGSSLVWCFVCAGLISRLFGGRGGLWRVWTYRICAIAFAWLALGTAREVISLLPMAG